MAKPPDGGPAFPVLHTIDGNWVNAKLAVALADALIAELGDG